MISLWYATRSPSAAAKLIAGEKQSTGKTAGEAPEEAGQILIEDGIIRLITFDPTQEVIVRWIP